MTKGKERDAWIQVLKRENPNRSKLTPKSSDLFITPWRWNCSYSKSIANHAYGRRYKKTNSTPLFQTPITSKENTSKER